MFDEYDDKAQYIMIDFEDLTFRLGKKYDLHFKEPPHDIARRFLNEIVEFEPIDKGGTGE